jgi:hypothetical protein
MKKKDKEAEWATKKNKRATVKVGKKAEKSMAKPKATNVVLSAGDKSLTLPL